MYKPRDKKQEQDSQERKRKLESDNSGNKRPKKDNGNEDESDDTIEIPKSSYRIMITGCLRGLVEYKKVNFLVIL